MVAGMVAVVTLLEAARRALGWPISFIAACFIGYAYAGPFLPGVLRHGGYSTSRLVGQLYLGQEGIFGIPLGVAASFVFIFILFGALLEVTGAGQFFIDLAYVATGRQRGGPAKAAVVASAAMGSVSGSAIANVVTSGAFTIPLMKKVGYRPEEAGGIEAAASTGGQILPPIMGAGAFLIAEYTGLPYLEVVKASFIPAILYMGTVFVFVHLVAVKRNLEGLPASELPRFGTTLAKGWHFLLALVVLNRGSSEAGRLVSSAGEPSIPRRDLGLPAFSAASFVVLAIALSLFQLYISGVRPFGLFYERAFHLAAVQVLAFLLFPTKGRGKREVPSGEPGLRHGEAGVRGGASGIRSGMAWTVDAAQESGVYVSVPERRSRLVEVEALGPEVVVVDPVPFQ